MIQTYEEEKQQVIKFLDMQMDTKERRFFIGIVSFRFNDPCTFVVATDIEEIEKFLNADMQFWKNEVFDTCEDKDHDQLFCSGEDLYKCDCGYALDISADYSEVYDNDVLADSLLDEQTIIINNDFETEFFEFLSHYQDDLLGRD